MTGTVADLALLFAASIAAGGVNAIAGGGTILTFPVLSAILPPGPGQLVSANVTSTIALWPGSAAAAWAWRRERATLPALGRWLLLPSIVGAVVGVFLLQTLPATFFDAVVPWLILLAAMLFAIQPQVTRFVAQRSRGASEHDKPVAAASDLPSPDSRRGLFWSMPPRLVAICGLQLLVGIYGGYFGAGLGVLILAMLGMLGLEDIYAVNAVKNLLAATVNGVAAFLFVIGGMAGAFEVSWLHVAVGAIGAVIGGIAVAKLSKRLPATVVRRLVAIIAFGLAGYYLWRQFA